MKTRFTIQVHLSLYYKKHNGFVLYIINSFTKIHFKKRNDFGFGIAAFFTNPAARNKTFSPN